jgi:hypothetical protein
VNRGHARSSLTWSWMASLIADRKNHQASCEPDIAKERKMGATVVI